MSNQKFTAEELKAILDQEIDPKDLRLPNFGGKVPKEINPPNFIKQKLGSGGIDEKSLLRADRILETNTVDFSPLAKEFLDEIGTLISKYEEDPNNLKKNDFLNMLISPSMQLKANGGMFNFELVSSISDLFVQFLENLEELDKDALDIMNAFYNALNVIIQNNIRGAGGKDGEGLLSELKSALKRYYDKKG